MFENPIFKVGTDKICKAIADATEKNGAYSVVGGGDSASAANKSGFKQSFSHISTGGGASLDFFSGKDLPGISCIQKVGENPKIVSVSAKPATKVVTAKKTTTSGSKSVSKGTSKSTTKKK